MKERLIKLSLLNFLKIRPFFIFDTLLAYPLVQICDSQSWNLLLWRGYTELFFELVKQIFRRWSWHIHPQVEGWAHNLHYSIKLFIISHYSKFSCFLMLEHAFLWVINKNWHLAFIAWWHNSSICWKGCYVVRLELYLQLVNYNLWFNILLHILAVFCIFCVIFLWVIYFDFL